MSDAEDSAENRIGAIETGQSIWSRAWSSVKETGRWVGGALKGQFSQQQTMGQIVFDAIISMFPLLGEGTAIRDSVAIVMRMADSDEARESTWEWINLVLCLIAVVPVVGGVLKGVGRLIVRAAEKSENMVELAEETALFLKRMGHGNAYEWLSKLDFMQYQSAMLDALANFLDRFSRACQFIVRNMSDVLPPPVVDYLSTLPGKLLKIQQIAGKMIPQALKTLNDYLARVREKLVDGSWADISVSSGRVITREAEGQLTTGARAAGKMAHPPATVKNYFHKEGWPDLTKNPHIKIANDTKEITYTAIESFSRDAPIRPIELKPGEYRLARVLDNTQRETQSGYQLTGVVSERAKRSPNWLPHMVQSGEGWRENYAVKFLNPCSQANF